LVAVAFYPIQIKLGTTREETVAALDSAKEKLLAGDKKHGNKQVDAAGV